MDINLSDLSDSDWLPGEIEGTAVSTHFFYQNTYKFWLPLRKKIKPQLIHILTTIDWM